jgi:3-hydroxyisobutyrate dehydrogenase
MRIGIAGLGRMGRAIAGRLDAAGFELAVWNRSTGRTPGFAARNEASPRALADSADIILTSLTDDAAVEAVYDGLLAGSVAGKLFIETSTIRPDTIARLAARVRASGADLVDAPIAGGPAMVQAGQCLAFIGGAPAAIERARPVLAGFCRRVESMGTVGTGAVMKLVANLPIGVYFQALAEALALGSRHGLDLEKMLGIMIDSPGAIQVLPRKLPVLLDAENEVAFDIAGVRKDLLAMTAAAQLAGVPTPAASGALSAYAAATASGWGGKDFAAIVRFWRDVIAAGP